MHAPLLFIGALHTKGSLDVAIWRAFLSKSNGVVNPSMLQPFFGCSCFLLSRSVWPRDVYI